MILPVVGKMNPLLVQLGTQDQGYKRSPEILDVGQENARSVPRPP